MNEIEQHEVFLKACKQYERDCERLGGYYDQPSEVLSTVTEEKIDLANVNGHLVTYKNPRRWL